MHVEHTSYEYIYIWIIYSSVDDVSYFKGLQGPMVVLKF